MSWPAVNGPGQATVKSPAATADATPVAESSKATARSGRAPTRAHAARNGSGCGLPCSTWSIVVMATNLESSPSCSRTYSTQAESEFEATASGISRRRGVGDQRGHARAEHERGEQLVVVAALAGVGGGRVDGGGRFGDELGHPVGDHDWPTTCAHRSIG